MILKNTFVWNLKFIIFIIWTFKKGFYKFVLRYSLVLKNMDCKVVQNYVVTPIKLGEGCFGTVYRGYVKNNKS